MIVNPITPNAAIAARKDVIPPFVFQAFNELIVEHLQINNTSTVPQYEVLRRILKLSGQGLHTDTILNCGWLNVESIYRQAGWKVEYVAPAYNEDFKPYFRFSKKYP